MNGARHSLSTSKCPCQTRQQRPPAACCRWLPGSPCTHHKCSRNTAMNHQSIEVATHWRAPRREILTPSALSFKQVARLSGGSSRFAMLHRTSSGRSRNSRGRCLLTCMPQMRWDAQSRTQASGACGGWRRRARRRRGGERRPRAGARHSQPAVCPWHACPEAGLTCCCSGSLEGWAPATPSSPAPAMPLPYQRLQSMNAPVRREGRAPRGRPEKLRKRGSCGHELSWATKRLRESSMITPEHRSGGSPPAEVDRLPAAPLPPQRAAASQGASMRLGGMAALHRTVSMDGGSTE